jgi:hypothetical protein
MLSFLFLCGHDAVDPHSIPKNLSKAITNIGTNTVYGAVYGAIYVGPSIAIKASISHAIDFMSPPLIQGLLSAVFSEKITQVIPCFLIGTIEGIALSYMLPENPTLIDNIAYSMITGITLGVCGGVVVSFFKSNKGERNVV